MNAARSRPAAGAHRARVVVVGAGIAGLAAAHALREAGPDLEVVVLEATQRVGGKLFVREVGGVTVDLGAEAMLNRRPEGVALAEAVGLGERVEHPRTTAARIWSRGRLRPMPRSLIGVPVDPVSLARSGLLSPRGLARAALDLVLPGTDLAGRDVSVGELVERRFGPEVVDRLVEPLLGGVYAGHSREISARAAVPQIVALLPKGRSLGKAAAVALGGSEDTRPVFAGLAGGIGQLPVVLARRLDVRTSSTVRELTPASGGGWHLVVGPTTAPERIRADAVVLAVPATAAARLLSAVSPTASTHLAQIEYASVAVVSTAFRRSDVADLPGSGFLVPPVDGRAIKAATFVSAKWGWVDAASEDLVVLRTSVGRHRDVRALQVPDEELVRRSVADLQRATGLAMLPVDAVVQRWGGGLPQYAVGHLERVRRIRDGVAGQSGLAVCGAAYDGVGIPACIASAQRAAESILDQLSAPGARLTAGPGE